MPTHPPTPTAAASSPAATQQPTPPDTSPADTSPANRHPVIVRSVISIEAWERFSFYGMQAILGYYLYFSLTDGGLEIPVAQATALVGSYGALVYLCTFIGGWIGDRLAGVERTLLSGAILLVIGHLSLSILSNFPHLAKLGLAVGLLLIAAGSGMLKTAAITVLGVAYAGRDTDREVGFQFFYFGIQIAAIGGPLLTGWLATQYSFSLGFGAASVLMIIGMVLYGALRKRSYDQLSPALQDQLRYPQSPAKTSHGILMVGGVVALLGFIGATVATGTIAPTSLAKGLLFATITVALVLFTIMLRSSKVTAAERFKIYTYIPIFIASAAFWAIMNQTFGVLAVYSEKRVDRSIGNFEVPASWSQSLNPLYVILLTVPFAVLWTKLGQRNPHPGYKLAMGVGIASCGFFLFIPYAGGAENTTPYLILAGAIFIATVGEMFTGPVGMAATTGFSPQAFRTQFSALYFLTMAVGTAIAGSISPLYNAESASAEISYFLGCAVVGLLIACGCALATWKLRRHAAAC